MKPLICYLFRDVTEDQSQSMATEEADDKVPELPEFSAGRSESTNSVNTISNLLEKSSISIGCESETSLTP